MKDDKSKDRKSQKEQEDVDFEILDALEQVEQAEKAEEESLRGDEHAIELTLDDEDLSFEAELEEEGAYQVGESMPVDLEKDVIAQGPELRFNVSFEEETGEEPEAVIESLDIEQEEGADEMGFSFDEEAEIDFEEPGVDMQAGEVSFDLEEEAGEIEFGAEDIEEVSEVEISQPPEELVIEKETEEGIEETFSESNLESFDIDSIDQGEYGEEEIPGLEEEDLGIPEDSTSFGIGDLLSSEETEIEREGTEETFDEMDLEGEIPTIDEEREFDIDLEEEGVSEEELLELEVETEPDEFQGKPVISVGEDQVIDLGSKIEEEQEELGQEEEEETVEVSELPEDKEETGFVEEIVPEIETEQGQEEDFLISLEDIDLEEEAMKVLETLEGVDEFSIPSGEESPEFDSEGGFDITADKDQETEAPSILETSLEKEIGSEDTEVQSTPEAYQGSQEEVQESVAAPETTPDVSELEIDDRELLGLTLRLGDEEVNEFDRMITEAKTLQSYVEELEKHKSEIKDRIYDKLFKEYNDRKIEIFSTSEFKSLKGDVKQDLEDMLRTREEFVSKAEELNDELEEITVRHLVGEYGDEMLSEQEDSKKSEIAHWNEKIEKIEKFITRYQELLDAEQGLNPLSEETISEEPEQEEVSEEEIDLISEEIPQEEEPEFPSAIEEEGFGSLEELAESIEISEGELTEQELPTEAEFEEEVGFDEFISTPEELEEEEEEQLTIGEEVVGEETEAEMINCKKCGRATPASEKFCVNCGAKAR